MDFSGEFRLQEILAFEKLFLKVLERRLESIFSFLFRKTRNAAVDVSAVFGVFVSVESFQPLFLCVFNNNRHVKIEQNRQDKQNKVRRKQKNSRADQKECAVNWISYNRIHAVCRKSIFLYMTFDFRLEIRINPKYNPRIIRTTPKTVNGILNAEILAKERNSFVLMKIPAAERTT